MLMSMDALLDHPPSAAASRAGRRYDKLSIMDETRLSLLERLRNPGDNAAWADFVQRYEPLLTSYIRKKGVPEHDVADVVQAIYVSLLRTMPTFEFDKARGRFRS